MPEQNGFHLGMNTNIWRVVEETRAAVRRFPEEIDQAVGQNATTVLRESIVEIDALIYSTAETPGYHRTKNLRRANQIKRIGPLQWLMFNDANYAGFVHDGTSHVLPRPWIQNAIDRKQAEMEHNLGEGGMRAFRRGGGGATQGAVSQGAGP